MDSAATILTVLVAAALLFVPVLVYVSSRARSSHARAADQAALDARADIKRLLEQTELSTQTLMKPVSYTHLTLPTILRV